MQWRVFFWEYFFPRKKVLPGFNRGEYLFPRGSTFFPGKKYSRSTYFPEINTPGVLFFREYLFSATPGFSGLLNSALSRQNIVTRISFKELVSSLLSVPVFRKLLGNGKIRENI